MPSTLITLGLDRLVRKAEALRSLDFDELLLEWRAILERDNDRGALAGLDGWDRPLAKVVYRPTRSKFAVSTAFRMLKNDNPTTAWYQTMDGPPLAPARKPFHVLRDKHTAKSAVKGVVFHSTTSAPRSSNAATTASSSTTPISTPPIARWI